MRGSAGKASEPFTLLEEPQKYFQKTLAFLKMMNGGSLYDLQKILGHTQFEMTQIYAHLSPEHLASKTQILSFGSEFLDGGLRVPLLD